MSSDNSDTYVNLIPMMPSLQENSQVFSCRLEPKLLRARFHLAGPLGYTGDLSQAGSDALV